MGPRFSVFVKRYLVPHFSIEHGHIFRTESVHLTLELNLKNVIIAKFYFL